MSACQGLLLRRPIADRFAPPMSAQVPSSGAANSGLQGDERCWAVVAANLPNHTFAITSDYGRNRRKNPDANSCFWCDLTFFRMNTCTKRVGGGGADSQLLLQLCSVLGAAPFGLKGAVSPCHDPRRLQLHPRRDCVTVRLKVRVRTSREAAVPCAHL